MEYFDILRSFFDVLDCYSFFCCEANIVPPFLFHLREYLVRRLSQINESCIRRDKFFIYSWRNSRNTWNRCIITQCLILHKHSSSLSSLRVNLFSSFWRYISGETRHKKTVFPQSDVSFFDKYTILLKKLLSLSGLL